MNDFERKVDAFMFAYMYQLEKALNDSEIEFQQIAFQRDEANTDDEFKLFLKQFILSKNKTLSEGIQSLTVYDNDKPVHTYTYTDFQYVSIKSVLLPDELGGNIKQTIRHDAVYTNPDLLLEIVEKSDMAYHSIELKSTKGDKIPGSSGSLGMIVAIY